MTSDALGHARPFLADMVWPVLATAAVAVPTALAYNVSPSATFFNQALSLVGWGVWLSVLGGSAAVVSGASAGLRSLQAAWALLLAAALASPLWAGLPWALSLSSAGLIAAAALAAQVGAGVQRSGHGDAAFRAFCIGLVVAGLVGTLVGIVQVFAPQRTDGLWIANATIAGRAVGNLRQPNHLSSLLMWSAVAALWLSESRVLPRRIGFPLVLLFIFAVVLTASRTGALSMGLLLLWGVFDRRLSRSARVLLVLTPLVYAAFWYGTSLWSDSTHQVFGGETRFTTKGDISSSRWGIWANTLSLIASHPWVGVGFGEFNFAWTLTPFPGRPVAFFDHTHDLLLQFLVELGLPLGATVIVLFAVALYAARPGLRVPAAADTRARPAFASSAFMIVLLILVHSLLEYPLWYAYFLLPAAFAFGLCLAGGAGGTAGSSAAASVPRRPWLPLIGGIVLVVGGLAALQDYFRVVSIFSPGDHAGPLEQRIEDGRRSWFFSHHASYAAATVSEHPGSELGAFDEAAHYLLDARLMMAWARGLAEAGDLDKARYVAQRLREFKNPQADEFFAACDAAPSGRPLPFQCSAPAQPLSYANFR